MVSDPILPELRSRLSVSLKPDVTPGRGRPLVLGVFSFRDDAHLVPGLIENIGPMVDGWVSCDDRSSDRPFGGERLRRKALLDAAVAHGAGWILAVGPAERFESALAGRIRDLVRVADPRKRRAKAYALLARNGFSPTVASALSATVLSDPEGRDDGLPDDTDPD